MKAAIEYVVLICPVVSTPVLNVLPMSTRRRAAKTVIGPEAKLAEANDAKNSLLEEISAEVFSTFMPQTTFAIPKPSPHLQVALLSFYGLLNLSFHSRGKRSYSDPPD
jgi:hypothetical protein